MDLISQTVFSHKVLSGSFHTGISAFLLVVAKTPGATILATPDLANFLPRPMYRSFRLKKSVGASR